MCRPRRVERWRKCAIELERIRMPITYVCYALSCYIGWGPGAWMKKPPSCALVLRQISNIYIERGTMYWWCEENKHLFFLFSLLTRRPQLLFCSVSRARSISSSRLILSFQSGADPGAWRKANQLNWDPSEGRTKPQQRGPPCYDFIWSRRDVLFLIIWVIHSGCSSAIRCFLFNTLSRTRKSRYFTRTQRQIHGIVMNNRNLSPLRANDITLIALCAADWWKFDEIITCVQYFPFLVLLRVARFFTQYSTYNFHLIG